MLGTGSTFNNADRMAPLTPPPDFAKGPRYSTNPTAEIPSSSEETSASLEKKQADVPGVERCPSSETREHVVATKNMNLLDLHVLGLQHG